jgi:hypothetical protein
MNAASFWNFLGVLRGAEQDDGVALLDEAGQLAVLLDDPRAGAVDDLEALRVRSLHDVRTHAVSADDDRRPFIDRIQRIHGPDAEALEVVDDALVVHDLAERVRALAGSRRFLGLVDRLANAVAEPGALRDADVVNGSHVNGSIARGTVRPPQSGAGSA